MGEFTVTGLRVLREAARSGSFSQAAQRLGYTQSAVSRQVALMEQAAGRPLFERQARGVEPTEAGRIVLRHADAVLAELDRARDALQDLHSRRSGRLRVGAFSTANAVLVPQATATVAQRHPELEVRLREGLTPALSSELGRRRLDLAVLSGASDLPAGLEVVRLLEDSLYIATATAHPLAGRLSVPIDRLRDERWITGSADQHTTLLGAWAGAAWQPHVAHVARDWITKLGLVAAGLGITVVPGLVVPALPDTVSVVRIDDPAAVRPTHVGYHPDRVDARHPFLTALREASAALDYRIRQRLHG
ncbi:LysR family transcriptional regulator [Nocardia sp. alder85J]|uniref:LysR family transcriptional regulator n=1 Tax=Nocardia sp. alder85J TaxID=2862949 RepID=UPI001CD24FA6|nr:LysR family transcriptional regulator [Nocardia sp. alder85J]MCX4098569.1 LysR family transcriptional regulator [Nocardia sp. alder85J]